MTTKKRPIIFLAVGIFNTLFDFTFYSLLTLTVLQGDDQIGLAGLISGTVALACAFLTHGLVTWRGSHIDIWTIVRFFIFTGFGMWVIRPLLLTVFIKLDALYAWVFQLSQTLHLPFSQAFIANTGSFGFMAVIVLVYNYATYNRFVFHKPKQRPVSEASSGLPS